MTDCYPHQLFTNTTQTAYVCAVCGHAYAWEPEEPEPTGWALVTNSGEHVYAHASFEACVTRAREWGITGGDIVPLDAAAFRELCRR